VERPWLLRPRPQPAQVCPGRHGRAIGGAFPADPAVLAELPGIGRSTAAAISAFSLGTRAAILDGNVKRVLTRCFGIDGFPGSKNVENALWTLAESLLPASDVDIYTQAQMDLGATVCTRGRPACGRCPVAGRCVALRDGRGRAAHAPPEKSGPRTGRALRGDCGRRCRAAGTPPATGIWGGLLSLPELAAQTLPDAVREAADWAAARGLACGDGEPLAPLVHGFTHFELHLVPLRLRLDSPTTLAGETSLHWLTLDTVGDAALPAPVRRLFARSDME
jgi:A/G-specific adenine glycosylase